MSIIKSKFKVVASGEKMTANDKEGDGFIGNIVGYVPIEDERHPSMVGKVQIKVPGESALFEDVINYNNSSEEMEQKSLGFLQQHTKSAMISAGKKADYNEDVSPEWCDQQLELLAKEHAEVKFNQHKKAGKKGESLKIEYVAR